ncbi:hypothetical protein Ciccas_009637 [Cichlidogyrus casuarinus]|uniref:Uncharacterized protein n=1 Tax=Cichlidogyrus casuarinus TaxID=1844966 RepID=A0ABD2PXG6_9PLAT
MDAFKVPTIDEERYVLRCRVLIWQLPHDCLMNTINDSLLRLSKDDRAEEEDLRLTKSRVDGIKKRMEPELASEIKWVRHFESKKKTMEESCDCREAKLSLALFQLLSGMGD